MPTLDFKISIISNFEGVRTTVKCSQYPTIQDFLTNGEFLAQTCFAPKIPNEHEVESPTSKGGRSRVCVLQPQPAGK